MATSTAEPEGEAENGATKQPLRFSVLRQGGLRSKVPKTAAMTCIKKTAELWSKANPQSYDSALLYDVYWRLIEAAGKSGSTWISARPGFELAVKTWT